jgi:TonB family protein
MTTKANIFLFLAILALPTIVFAQKKVETFYFNASWDSVKTRAEASYYRVIQTSGIRRIVTEYDSADVKLEEVYYRKDKPQSGVGDSVWWKYGSFHEWFSSGQLKTEGSYLFDRLHDNLKTYYPNGVLRRSDIYYIDTLKSGHCYAQDSSEIAYFAYREQPEFQGGLTAMFQFIADNIVYPESARFKNIEGTVYVGFVVNKMGEIVDVKIKRSVNKLLDKEALRVVKSMPKWKAGKLDGDLVRVAYTLPVKFKLE